MSAKPPMYCSFGLHFSLLDLLARLDHVHVYLEMPEEHKKECNRNGVVERCLSKKRRNFILWSATGFPLAFRSTKQHIVTCIVCTHHHTNKNTLDISLFFFFAGSGVSLNVLFHFL